MLDYIIFRENMDEILKNHKKNEKRKPFSVIFLSNFMIFSIMVIFYCSKYYENYPVKS